MPKTPGSIFGYVGFALYKAAFTAWKGPLYIRGAQTRLEAILGSVTL